MICFDRASLCFLLLAVVGISCMKQELPDVQPQYYVSGVIEYGKPLEFRVGSIVLLGADTRVAQDSCKDVSIMMDDVAIRRDTICGDSITTSIFPSYNAVYRVVVRDINGSTVPDESRPISLLKAPQVTDIDANSDVGIISKTSTQRIRHITCTIDDEIPNYGYFGFAVYVDTLYDETNVSTYWESRRGFNCPDISASSLFEENLGIVNLSCFDSPRRLALETSNHSPKDFYRARLTLCRMDEHTINIDRWYLQNHIAQDTTLDLSNIVSIHDDFSTGKGYDLIAHKSCSEIPIIFK